MRARPAAHHRLPFLVVPDLQPAGTSAAAEPGQTAGVKQRNQPSRAERRPQRASVADEGVYGVDAKDAGADSWTGRYLCWAPNAQDAKARIGRAGFHKKQISQRWSPGNQPPEGVPAPLTYSCASWFRSRRDDDGWTDWEALPDAYRHPSQALAAVDPTVR